ncbi:hypothetical protein [Arthrobacter sp. M4]|uniref:YegP family protein n=1 Tax=Arthrobacter sp. M4 TaxID=218160 RepID=UPI001CDB8543|nr:hypothetical protein [Arthrobacter sp. M4]MCA4135019.1 hypothetical protein [Arthrobacter sp. M4]
MAGIFELVDAPEGGYRVRLLDGAGALVAVSVTFPTKKAAAMGVAQTREIAGTGLIRDLSHDRREDPLRQSSIPISRTHAKNGVARQHRHLHLQSAAPSE